MKIFKKSLAVLLAVTMIVLAVPFTAMAANEPTITVSTSEAYPGETVDVTIDISNNPGIVAMLIKVAYDEDLTLVKIENGTTLNGPQHNPNGLNKNPYTVNFADDTAYENNTNNGTIITLTFEVAEDAEIDTAPVTVTYEEDNAAIYDVDFNDVHFDVVNGGVKVLGKDFTGLAFKDKTVTYNSEVQMLEVTGVPADATVAYTVNGEEFTGAETAGTYEVVATVSAPGYNTWKETATLTIEKKDLIIDVDVPSKVYDGTTTIENYLDCIIVDGIIAGDDVQLDNDNINLSYDIPDAGTWRVVGNLGVSGGDLGNYNVVYKWQQATATITPKPITVKADDITVKVGAAMPELTYTPTGLVDGDSLRGITLSTKANTKTAKEYPITIKSDKNYDKNYIITVVGGTFNVVDKSVQTVIIAPVGNKTYGDEAFALNVVAGNEVDSDVEYTSETPDVVAVMENYVVIVGAGTAKIAVSKAGNDDYADFSDTVTFTVAKKPLTITAENKTVRVGGEMPELTYELEGLLVGNDQITGSLATTAKNTNTVKDYPITQGTLSAGKNYDVTFVPGTLSVLPKTPQPVYVAPVENKTYGDESFELGYGVNENGNSSFVSDEPWVFTAETNNISVDGTTVTILGAGVAKIAASKKGDAVLADFSDTVTFTVNKKDVTVTADKITVMKGGALPTELTYKTEGLVDGDSLTGKLATTAKNTNTVKDYPITQGTLKANANYNLTFVPGVLSVVDKKIQNVTVNPNLPADLEYGSEGFKIDVTYGEIVTDAETTFTSSDDQVVKVDAEGNVTVVGAGEATITVSKAGNDKIADFEEEIDVVVAKREITVNAVDNFKKVGAQDPALTYTYVGELVGDDAFTGNVARKTGEAVGEYDITIGDLALNDNYKIIFNGATFTIFDKTPQNITLTSAYSKTYGDNSFALDVQYGTVNVSENATTFVSDNENVATVDAQGNVALVGAGTAKITVAKAGNEDLADFSKDVTVTVAKKEIKVTAEPREKYVGQDTPELTYTYEGELVGGDEFTGELAVNDLDKVGGKYDIKIGTLTLGDNYKITFVGAKLEVLAKVDQKIELGAPDAATYGDEGLVLSLTKVDCNADAEVVFDSTNKDVATVDADGNITITGVGSTKITVAVAGNYKYNDFSDDVELTVAPKQIEIEAIDFTNKTVSFNAVLEADRDLVSVDFNKVTFVPEEVEEGQTPEKYVASGFELVGEKSANYALLTENVEITIASGDIDFATVTAIAENGTVEGTGTYLVGSEVTVKAVANRNYKFNGWYVGEEKVSSSAEYTFTLQADTELRAEFKKNNVSVGGGGTPTRVVYFKVSDEVTNKVTVDKGAKVKAPEEPVLEGFVFGGWFTDEECTKEYNFDAAVDTSITLYAKWTEVEKPDDGEETPDDNKDDEQGTDAPEKWDNPYSDVDDEDWFYDVVKSVTEAGIMNGVSESEFAPDMLVTRAMVVTMLYRAEGQPNAVNEAPFDDVAEDAYYASAVAWAAENGIVLGYDEDTFAPDDNVTREQIAAIIFRYAVHKGLMAVDLTENLAFADADKISEYAVAPMNWLVGQEIITGYSDGTIRPQAGATRAEVAAVTARILSYFN